jgi:ABC-type sulfate transport system permease component
MNYLIVYFIIVFIGALVTLWQVFLPAMELVVMVEKHHAVAASIYGTFIAGVTFFLICMLLGPLMLYILGKQRAFIKGFARGMLENNIN